jgi:hypothetical protein
MKLDTTKGWCCDGLTYAEHHHADGKCCQPEGTHLDDLPDAAREAAKKRLKSEVKAEEREPAATGS